MNKYKKMKMVQNYDRIIGMIALKLREILLNKKLISFKSSHYFFSHFNNFQPTSDHS